MYIDVIKVTKLITFYDPPPPKKSLIWCMCVFVCIRSIIRIPKIVNFAVFLHRR